MMMSGMKANIRALSVKIDGDLASAWMNYEFYLR